MTFGKAKEEDKELILKLYREAIGSEGCTWSMEYPNESNIENDFKRDALLCLKDCEGEIVGAVSIDDDRLVEELTCWDRELKPAAELARLVVKEDCRNQGIARVLLKSAMDELRQRGYKAVHFLVSKTNYRALNSYAKLDFVKKGDSDLFGENWWCYEKRI